MLFDQVSQVLTQNKEPEALSACIQVPELLKGWDKQEAIIYKYGPKDLTGILHWNWLSQSSSEVSQG